MNQPKQTKKPNVKDSYQGLKKEAVVVTLTDKNGQVTKINI